MRGSVARFILLASRATRLLSLDPKIRSVTAVTSAQYFLCKGDSRHRRAICSNDKGSQRRPGLGEPRPSTQVSEQELNELEEGFGPVLAHELALWFIRNPANRDATERMLNAAEPGDYARLVQPH